MKLGVTHLSAERDFFLRSRRSRTYGTVTEHHREKSGSAPRTSAPAKLGLARSGVVRKSEGGYTLIEVLMFLAISGALLAVSIVAIRGQAAHAEFTSGVNDVNAKMQQWINQVVTGYGNSSASPSAAAGNYKCMPNAAAGFLNGYPELSTAAVARGSNPECVFLGRVIQVSTDSTNAQNTHINSYTILGRRTYTAASGDAVNVDSIANAKPIAAVFPQDSIPHDVDLTEDYAMPGGVRILSVTNTLDATHPSRVAGIFTSLKNGSANNSASDLNAVQYTSFTNNVNKNDSSILKCIRLQTCTAPEQMKDWVLCLDGARGDDRAKLTLRSNNGSGLFTILETGKGNLCS